MKLGMFSPLHHLILCLYALFEAWKGPERVNESFEVLNWYPNSSRLSSKPNSSPLPLYLAATVKLATIHVQQQPFSKYCYIKCIYTKMPFTTHLVYKIIH